MLESLYLTKSKVRARLLGILFSNPEKKYYLSELARLAEASAGNVQRELERFVRDELVRREKKGNLTFYVPNPRHALFPEIRSLVLKTAGMEAELRRLVSARKDVRLALLYGSFARQEEKGESDVDLMVIADGKLEKLYSSLSTLERKFSREINVTAYSPQEFKKKINSADSFIKNVLRQPHRILKGDLREFQKAAA